MTGANPGQEIVEQLATARVAAGLSQEAVANRMGSSVPQVSRVECGRQSPSVSWLVRYAAAVGRRVVLVPAPRSTPC